MIIKLKEKFKLTVLAWTLQILSKSRVIPLVLDRVSGSRLYLRHTDQKAVTCFGDSGAAMSIERPGGEVELVSVLSGVIKTKGSFESCSV